MKSYSICFLCLVCSTYHDVLWVHPCCHNWQNFLFYGWTLFHWVSHTHTYVCIYHIFFIHSFICQNLGCFCILLLWIVLQWTLKCRYLFKILSFPLDIYPEVGLLDDMVILFLIFWGTSLLFSIVSTPIYLHTSNIQGFPLLHILTNTYLFDNPNKCEVVSHRGFDLHFSAKWCWASFHVPVDRLFIFVQLQILCLFLNWTFCFVLFFYRVVWVPCPLYNLKVNEMDCSPTGSSAHGILQVRILEWVAFTFSRESSQPRDRSQIFCTVGRFFTIWATREAPLIRYMVYKYFSHSVGCHFIWLTVSFAVQKLLVWYGPILFSPLLSCGCHIQKSLPRPISPMLFHHVFFYSFVTSHLTFKSLIHLDLILHIV